MELLCPNCQQRVTVPDQYAGQVMQCPLCHNTFTTPSLTSAAAPAYIPPPPSPPPEPFAALPTSAGPTDAAPVVSTAAPQGAPGDYRRRLTIWFSPRVLPWIAVAALFIVFVLTFFSWVGYYPGIPLETQSAWQAAFGSYWLDPDVPRSDNTKGPPQHVEPRVSGLMIVYLVLLIVALLSALASAAITIVPTLLPQGLVVFRALSWAIVGGLTLLAFLFLILQLLGGFDLTNQFQDHAKKLGETTKQMAEAAPNAEAKKQAEKGGAIAAGMIAIPARFTCAFWASFWLTLVAGICALLTFALSRRTSRPLPRLELAW